MKKSTPKFQLEKARLTFWLTGLCIVLAAVYGLLEMKTEMGTARFENNAKMEEMNEIEIPITLRKKLQKPAQKKVEKPKIDLTSKPSRSQKFKKVSNQLTTIEHTDTALYSIEPVVDDFDIEVDMSQLDKKPIFPGCENLLSEKERFDCFQKSMIQFVQKNFVPCQNAWGTASEKLYVKFVINENGQVVNPQILRGEDVCNKKKAEQMIAKLPDMQPGKYRDMNVKTSFVLPINIK